MGIGAETPSYRNRMQGGARRVLDFVPKRELGSVLVWCRPPWRHTVHDWNGLSDGCHKYDQGQRNGRYGGTVCVAVHVGDVRSGIRMSKSGHLCGENAHRYDDSGMNDHPNDANAPRRALEQDVPQAYPMPRRTAHQAHRARSK